MKYCYEVQDEYEKFSGKDPFAFYCPLELEVLPLYRLTKERMNDTRFRAICDENSRPVDCSGKQEAYVYLAEMLNHEVEEWEELREEVI